MNGTNETGVKVLDCFELPSLIDEEATYRLLAVDRGREFYHERVDRNIGWISMAEQEILRNSKVAVAGCGGMGGVAIELLLRMGVGEIRIADPEAFDASNIHRQIAAGVDTMGMSKAIATATRMRSITDDTTLIVYPRGVTPETVAHFVEGANLVLDEVEAWAIAPRICLHREARLQRVDVINCNSIGAGTRLFLFTPESETMEECLGIDYPEAIEFHESLQKGTATLQDKLRVGNAVIRGLLPELPEYFRPGSRMSTAENLRHRLLEEGKAMILASNPYGAASFMVTHTIFHLLRNSGVHREILRPMAMPAYLYRDDLLGELKIVTKKWY